MKRILRTLASLSMLLFFAGCVSTSNNPEIVVKNENAAPAAVPSWYLHGPEEKGEAVVAYGVGPTEEAAEANAVTQLKRWLAEEAVKPCRAKEKDAACRYLGKDAARKIEAVVEASKVPYETEKSETVENNATAVAVRVEKKGWAKPLKREILRRLVPIEERWHAASKKPVSERVRIAESSRKGLTELLPAYLAVQRLDPYGETMRRRIVHAIPYFDAVKKRLRRTVVYCVEPPASPALRLFARAVKEGLKAKGAQTVAPKNRTPHTLCVTVKGRLVHSRKGENHIVDARVELLFHEPYKPPVATRRYNVRGVSPESGTAALEEAAEKLRRLVAKERRIGD